MERNCNWLFIKIPEIVKRLDVDGIEWFNGSNYTKNLRHNFVNTSLAKHIKRFASRILGIKDKDPGLKDELIGSAFYSPPNNEDFALSIFASGQVAVEHLTASGQIEHKYLMDEGRNVIDGLLKEPNLLPQYLRAKGIFDIDPKSN